MTLPSSSVTNIVNPLTRPLLPLAFDGSFASILATRGGVALVAVYATTVMIFALEFDAYSPSSSARVPRSAFISFEFIKNVVVPTPLAPSVAASAHGCKPSHASAVAPAQYAMPTAIPPPRSTSRSALGTHGS